MKLEDILNDRALRKDPTVFAAKVLGTAVLYSAAVVNGAKDEPVLTDEQVQKAAMSFLSIAAEGNLVVNIDPQKAGVMRAMLEIAVLSFKAGAAGNDMPAPASEAVN